MDTGNNTSLNIPPNIPLKIENKISEMMAYKVIKSNGISSCVENKDGDRRGVSVSYLSHGWADCGTYYLNLYEQGTDGWHSARRKGIILTDGTAHEALVRRILSGSNFGTAAGLTKPPYKSREEYMRYWALDIEETFSPQAKVHMARGTKNEPMARMVYEHHTGNKVVEVGLAIPKWDVTIGGSVDGLVGDDGMIEIKCPEYIYRELKEYDGKNIEPELYIRGSHYCQMLGGMAILGRKWCDYVVYGVLEQKLYVQRIEFNPYYWENVLYPKMRSFIQEGEAMRLASIQSIRTSDGLIQF